MRGRLDGDRAERSAAGMILPRRLPLTWLSITCLIGCAAEPVRTSPEFDALASMQVDDFPGASKILRGFDAGEDEDGLRVGDAALLALCFTRDGATRRQLLLLEVAELPRTTSTAEITQTNEDGRTEHIRIALSNVVVDLHRFDVQGAELGSGRATLFREALQAGWWADFDPTTPRQVALAFVLKMSMQNLATAEPTIEDMLFLVADAPSLLSIATHLGVNVTVVAGRAGPVEATPPALEGALGREIRVLPIDLEINGSQTLWSELLVVQPHGANIVCGGLVGAVARHPSEPGRTALVRLIATRRGKS